MMRNLKNHETFLTGLASRLNSSASRCCSLFVVGLLFLTSCALPPAQETQERTRLPTDAEVEQYNAQVSAEERIICRPEVRVGTNIPKRTCRLVRDIEETSQVHRAELRNVLR